MNCLTLNQVFLRYSSHTICGIKPSNLFTVAKKKFEKSNFAYWKQLCRELGLSLNTIKISPKTIMIFIYNPKWIDEILENPNIHYYLLRKGYTCFNERDKVLPELFTRLKKNKSFPHEVGIFLGYPFEDVINFEEHEGRFCKYCGYWKSYCNPREAKKRCRRYKQCSQMCTQWFDEGYSIPQIIRKYKKLVLEAA